MLRRLVQELAKEWSLGCVIPKSWPLLAAGARFTQPGHHSLADPCIIFGNPCRIFYEFFSAPVGEKLGTHSYPRQALDPIPDAQFAKGMCLSVLKYCPPRHVSVGRAARGLELELD